METFAQSFERLPQIRAGIGLYQEPNHGLYDVYDHTMQVFEEARKIDRSLGFGIAALLHDIGKPDTARPMVNGAVHELNPLGKSYNTFKKHEEVGQGIVERLNPRLFTADNLDQNLIATLVGSHGLPHEQIKELRYFSNIQHWPWFLEQYQTMTRLIKSRGIDPKQILDLFLADKRGGGNSFPDQEEVELLISTILKSNHPTTSEIRRIYDLQRGLTRDS